MEQFDLYGDIVKRTNGDIYIGVVGPVRTGKSTFIKRFMELIVLPNIENPEEVKRATDELPQSAEGKTIMTTQPDFIPKDAVKIPLNDTSGINVRLIDCVGYLIDGVLGHTEDDKPRMVSTPWASEPLPFEKAAEIGTRKVIRDHSTIGIAVTTDGSITGLPRGNYIEAEEKVISELKSLGKPFTVLLNTKEPYSVETQRLQLALEEKYGVPVSPVDLLSCGRDEMKDILEQLLYEFPLRETRIKIPRWVQALPESHPLIKEIFEALPKEKAERMREHAKTLSGFKPSENITGIGLDSLNLGEGAAVFELNINDNLFYKILGEECGCEIKGDYHLIALMSDLIKAKKEYDRIAEALRDVKEKGYGVVCPTMDEMTLEEPEIVKRGGHFGVKLKASAPSLHLMQVNINTEVNPIVGSEKQSEELVNYLIGEFENDPQRIWESNMFGKSLHELVMEGIETKLDNMPQSSRGKIQKTMERIVNDGGGGLICILF